ncbi:uncharacterized protein LOC135224760 [Macrobrachium nipponense]|uniref:uncharacterized protein LOC135224760 n=1 Tax=Macrobrachium nipponense TaxID=159736 RepID=UPI0030C85A16
MWSMQEFDHLLKGVFRVFKVLNFLDWSLSALAKKVEEKDSPDIPNLLSVMSCMDKALRDGTNEVAAIFTAGIVKKRSLLCSFTAKGVTQPVRFCLLRLRPREQERRSSRNSFFEENSPEVCRELLESHPGKAASSLPKGGHDQTVLQTQIGAKLSLFWEAWRDRGAGNWTLQILREGYKIPFYTKPSIVLDPLDLTANYKDSNKRFALKEQIELMLLKKAIEPVSPQENPGFYNRLFLVPKSSGGWRPVLDISALNAFVVKTKFTMETTQSVLSALRPGDWMVSLDLQDAYFHVPIHPSSRKYLRFLFKGRVFQFRALCLGLSTAPQIFTAIMANVARWQHEGGIRISLYLDDWLLRASSKKQCLEDMEITLNLVQEIGLVVNLEKSHLEPSCSIIYLGVLMNSQDFRASPSQERQDRCLKRVQEFLERQ